PKSILRRVLSPTGFFVRVHHVVLLHHSSGRTVGSLEQTKPATGRLAGQVGAPVAPYPFDREPLERRPAVRAVPLLARREVRRDEAAGLQKVALEARGDASALIVTRNPEVERRGCASDGRSVTSAPPPVRQRRSKKNPALGSYIARIARLRASARCVNRRKSVSSPLPFRTNAQAAMVRSAL